MRIKIRELVPTDWTINTTKRGLTLWFKSKRGNYNRKPFVFPEEIEIDEQFTEWMGLILGDGDMHRKEKRHFGYASKDPELSVFVLNTLRQKLFLDNKDVTFLLHYRDIDPGVPKMAELLGVRVEAIKTRFSARHNYPTLHIQVNGVVFRLMLEQIVSTFLSSNFLREQEFRRGFLRGLFAAEGCVGIKYREKYINQVEFALSIHEIELLAILAKALSHEGIAFKIVKNERRHFVQVIIQNWQNYLKCWQIGLFDRCERKKKAFLEVAQSSQVYAEVAPEDLQELSESFMQRELARIIGSWQGNVCRILQGKILLSLEQIQVLEKLGYTFAIQKLRVGNLTELPYSPETMNLFRGKMVPSYNSSTISSTE